jgi:hypothetical protein
VAGGAVTQKWRFSRDVTQKWRFSRDVTQKWRFSRHVTLFMSCDAFHVMWRFSRHVTLFTSCDAFHVMWRFSRHVTLFTSCDSKVTLFSVVATLASSLSHKPHSALKNQIFLKFGIDYSYSHNGKS